MGSSRLPTTSEKAAKRSERWLTLWLPLPERTGGDREEPHYSPGFVDRAYLVFLQNELRTATQQDTDQVEVLLTPFSFGLIVEAHRQSWVRAPFSGLTAPQSLRFRHLRPGGHSGDRLRMEVPTRIRSPGARAQSPRKAQLQGSAQLATSTPVSVHLAKQGACHGPNHLSRGQKMRSNQFWCNSLCAMNQTWHRAHARAGSGGVLPPQVTVRRTRLELIHSEATG